MSSEKSIIDIKSWDGTIAFGEFYTSSCAFADQWKKFNSGLPQWTWVRCSKLHGVPATRVEGYLCMDNLILPGCSMEDNHECSDGGMEEMVCLEDEEFVDSAVLVQRHKRERCHYDFHVVYSSSYRVPVLYFRAYWSDGQPLALGDMEKEIPASAIKELTSSKWTFITQEIINWCIIQSHEFLKKLQEHPYLNRPWFTLHPCGTSEWMKLLFTSDASAVAVDRYLASWFSVVAQVFGLKLPFEMFSNACSP